MQVVLQASGTNSAIRPLSLALLILCAVLNTAAAWRPKDLWRRAPRIDSVSKRQVLPDVQPWSGSSPVLPPALREGDALSVCQCEDASLAIHGGLQCEKEGWFVHSFEAIGRWVRCPAGKLMHGSVGCRACLWQNRLLHLLNTACATVLADCWCKSMLHILAYTRLHKALYKACLSIGSLSCRRMVVGRCHSAELSAVGFVCQTQCQQKRQPSCQLGQMLQQSSRWAAMPAPRKLG
jgi:hypothetical protein